MDNRGAEDAWPLRSSWHLLACTHASKVDWLRAAHSPGHSAAAAGGPATLAPGISPMVTNGLRKVPAVMDTTEGPHRSGAVRGAGLLVGLALTNSPGNKFTIQVARSKWCEACMPGNAQTPPAHVILGMLVNATPIVFSACTEKIHPMSPGNLGTCPSREKSLVS